MNSSNPSRENIRQCGRRGLLGLIVVACFFLALPIPHLDAADWTPVRIEGRDYVSAAEIAQFYSLGESLRPAENRLNFLAEHADLQFQINSREVQINGVRHWLGFAPFEHEGRVLVSRIDLVKTLEPALRPNAIPDLKVPRTVVLDPGHGGHDLGAVADGNAEKNLNLGVCLYAAELLRAKGFKVIFTRDKDVFVPLEKRAEIANAHPDAILVSVHFNDSLDNSDANGFEVFALTPRGAPSTADTDLRVSHMEMQAGNARDSTNLALATAIQHAVLGNMPQFDRGVKRARFAVLKLAKIPAVLVEGGFLSNPSDRALAAKESWRCALAASIAAGVVDYRRLATEHRPPKLVADYQVAPSFEETTGTVSVDPAVILPSDGE